jgi:hypothetical protein
MIFSFYFYFTSNNQNQVKYSSFSSLSNGTIFDSIKVQLTFQSATRSVDFWIVSGSVSIKREVWSSNSVGVRCWLSLSSSSSSFSVSTEKKLLIEISIRLILPSSSTGSVLQKLTFRPVSLRDFNYNEEMK